MSVCTELSELEAFIENAGMYTSMRYDQNGNQELICCSSTTGGNSFWILYSKLKDCWYLVTWTPRYYRFSSKNKDEVFTTVLQALHLQDEVMWGLPETFMHDHGLERVEEPVNLY